MKIIRIHGQFYNVTKLKIMLIQQISASKQTVPGNHFPRDKGGPGASAPQQIHN